jgi:hypothetical protein
MGRRRYYPPERTVRKLATDFWFAVQRMARRGEGPPPPLTEPPPDNLDDDDLSEVGVPRRPSPSSGSASAAVPEPDEDTTK